MMVNYLVCQRWKRPPIFKLYWIPACAGMTGVDAGMTGGDAGMTERGVARQSL